MYILRALTAQPRIYTVRPAPALGGLCPLPYLGRVMLMGVAFQVQAVQTICKEMLRTWRCALEEIVWFSCALESEEWAHRPAHVRACSVPLRLPCRLELSVEIAGTLAKAVSRQYSLESLERSGCAVD